MTTWRRRAFWGSAGLLLAGFGVAGWLGWTAQQARAELFAARDELPAIRTAVMTGDGSAAVRLQRVRRHADAADDLTHDPVWSLVAGVPFLGAPAATTSGMARAVRGIADTGMPALVEAADVVHPARLLSGGGRLDVEGLAAAVPALDRAAASLTSQQGAVDRLAPSWFAPVAGARASLRDELVLLAGTSRDAASAAKLVPPMLGLDGPRRYFVAFQNPAESRGTGGLLDAFAIVRADRGKVSIERMGANTQLPPMSGEVAGPSQEYVDRYAAVGGTREWLQANVSPQFPDVATVWEEMWRHSTGQQLDGAVALDPRALSAVLQATGPVTAPTVGTVDAKRIESLVLHDQYLLPRLAAERKPLMLGVGSAAIDALLTGRAKPTVLLPRLQDVARQGHLLIQSRIPAEQKQLVAAGIGGAVEDTARPFAEAVVVNIGGNKLDSWLATSLGYRVEQCQPTKRTVAVTMTLHNGAPRSGLPPYVTVRSDQPAFPVVPGQNRVELDLLVTRGAQLVNGTLDGAPLLPEPPEGQLPDTLPGASADTFVSTGQTGGRPAYWLDLEVQPGVTRTVVLRFTEPPSTESPLLPVQPLVIPPTVKAELGSCAVGAKAAG
jgi:hypothetical protein